MNSLPPLEIVSLTDADMSRSHNEDRHAGDVAAGFGILADRLTVRTAYSPQAASFELAWQAGTPCYAQCEWQRRRTEAIEPGRD